MSVEKRELRSWRQRVATPLKGVGDEISEEVAPNKPTNLTNLNSLRVGLLEVEPNKPKQTPGDPCVMKGCTDPIADGDLVYCAAHRVGADDGTLWGSVTELPRQRLVSTGPNTWVEAEWARSLCVNCDQPVAPGDLIACAEHRKQIDALLMPWEGNR